MILGITDSRPPGAALTQLEADALSRTFGLSCKGTSGHYGFADTYFFYKQGKKYVKCYAPRYSSGAIYASELQNRLSELGLAPRVLDVELNEKCLKIESELAFPIQCEELQSSATDRINRLHLGLDRVFSLWPEGVDLVKSTSEEFHRMIDRELSSLNSKYNLITSKTEDFSRVVEQIRGSTDYGHGDMHPGNIMMLEGDILFIDFESVFHSYGAGEIDYHNLNRFGPYSHYQAGLTELLVKNEKEEAIRNYLMVKNAIVNEYLESIGAHVPEIERKKFLQEICNS